MLMLAINYIYYTDSEFCASSYIVFIDYLQSQNLWGYDTSKCTSNIKAVIKKRFVLHYYRSKWMNHVFRDQRYSRYTPLVFIWPFSEA